MYWCKTFNKLSVYASALLLIGSAACTKPEIKETGAQLKYFDLKGYFEKESARLGKTNKLVAKTVAHNGEAESKQVKITSWTQELNLFTESDINKPAWRNSYQVDSAGGTVTYKAKLPELKTREIILTKVNGQVASIAIINNVENFLYQTTEKLRYEPAAGYSIEKTQHVKVIGVNDYIVSGKFN